MENQVIASSLCLPPSAAVTLRSSRGVCVGNRHQRLWPEINAFHALVPNGSICIPVPIAKKNFFPVENDVSFYGLYYFVLTHLGQAR